MRIVRRWFIYRRLVRELTDAPERVLTELGTPRKAIKDFAWHCAHVESDRAQLPLAQHQSPHRVATDHR